jgi:hypothetical protein
MSKGAEVVKRSRIMAVDNHNTRIERVPLTLCIFITSIAHVADMVFHGALEDLSIKLWILFHIESDYMYV